MKTICDWRYVVSPNGIPAGRFEIYVLTKKTRDAILRSKQPCKGARTQPRTRAVILRAAGRGMERAKPNTTEAISFEKAMNKFDGV